MMNDGMKIILERLKTHPEEFTDDSNPFASEGKWTKLIHQYQHNLAKEDMDAFKSAIDEIRQTEFTAKVMEELLDPKLEEQLTLTPIKQASGTLSVGATLGAYANTATTTLTLDNTRLHELLHMKAEIDLQRQKQKQSKTLFGRLFNYS